MILSAIAGKAALKVFKSSSVKVVTTRKTLDEVGEYLPEMARRYGLAPQLLEAQLGLLAIRAFGEETYTGMLEQAWRRIGRRDPDDADLLALAMALRVPVWSNDSDFSGTGVTWYTTARLLRKLGIR